MDLNTIKDTSIWKETNHGKTMSFTIRKLIDDDFFRGKEILELGGGIANHSNLMLENNPKNLTVTEITSKINL